MSLFLGNLVIHARWYWSGLFLLLFTLLISLGFWQLRRAQEKSTIVQDWSTKQALPAIPFDEYMTLTPSEQKYRRAHISGRFIDDYYWLVRRSDERGLSGNEVLQHFVVSAVETGLPLHLVVNRGWQASHQHIDIKIDEKVNAKRHTANFGENDDTPIRITGFFKPARDSNSLINQSAALNGVGTTLIPKMPALGTTAVNQERLLPNDFYAQLFQLDPDSPRALKTDWSVINMPSHRHHAYAFQWFALSLALLVLWVKANTNIFDLIKYIVLGKSPRADEKA